MSTNPPSGPPWNRPAPQPPYGTPQQPGQQFPQGYPAASWPNQGQPAAPQHYGAPQQTGFQQSGYAAPPSRPRKTGKAPTVIVTALITGVVAVTATLLATGTLTGPATFDDAAVAEGVAEVLSTNFDLTDVEDVWCPAGIEATEGTEFECTFTSGGEDLSIPITVLNDEGQYRVGGPSPS
ncbi:protein of unknown function [Sanguibacter gelidistatuariae]|uniref:DUF4333 domain-containing protein n=1 Tax=Sanguibacter gelidistatuariae TaxID=1814289 RepID=A0A1G6HB80_9MICO|nr:DUF4333 domain-containing protein [Sanguibacter gelidistatuariae]SDB90696.1 protein of unknown function [Sanguibacter gelidistatuariae]